MKNLNLVHTISLKALEAKARKAAATAAIASKNRTPKVTKVKTKKIPLIEREINSIFRSLCSTSSDNQVVMMDQANKGTSRKAIISIYNRDDLSRQKEEEAAYRKLHSEGENRNGLRKPYKAFPVLMYVFYPHTLDEKKLGSVAIYGSDVSVLLSVILKKGSLFGHHVVSANLEMGRRLFIDVKLAA